MEIITRIFFGGLGTALGFVMVSKADWFCNNFGRIPFFEKYVGGTRNGYRIIGLIIIFIAFVYLTGMEEGFLNFVLSPLIRKK